MPNIRLTVAAVLASLPFCAAEAQESSVPTAPAQKLEMNAAELFAYADNARDRGDYTLAEKAYRALSRDPAPELQTEARFRLGMMLADKMGKFREAAVEFRQILDDKPDAAGVRLQLARMQVQLGNLMAARKELRAAQATGLPPEVEQQVRFYARALNAYKRFGGSLELAVAPSNNINRATKSDTLGTVIGNFTLDDEAKAKSGIGVSVRGQTYGKVPLGEKVDLLARLSGSADLYRDGDFNDLALSLQLGPQWRWGADRLSLAGQIGHRWYGGDPYSVTAGVAGDWTHPAGKRGQLRVSASYLHDDNQANNTQDSDDYALSLAVDRAFSGRFGGGLQVNGRREVARDPGYSTAQGGVSAYLFREFGKTTAVINLGYNRLEADKRLFLYPERRKGDRFSASLSGTFRTLRIGTFAPLARIKYERNKSSIEIYDFKRVAAEFGVTAAF